MSDPETYRDRAFAYMQEIAEEDSEGQPSPTSLLRRLINDGQLEYLQVLLWEGADAAAERINAEDELFDVARFRDEAEVDLRQWMTHDFRAIVGEAIDSRELDDPGNFPGGWRTPSGRRER